MKRSIGLGTLAAFVLAWFAPSAIAEKAPAAAAKSGPGKLVIDDKAEAFSKEGIKKAEDAFHNITFKSTTELTIVTFAKVPESKRTKFEELKSDKAERNRFFGEWARELAKNRNTRGIFVLICREGSGIHAISDRQTDAKRGFDDADLKRLEGKIATGFVNASKLESKDGPEAMKIRDDALIEAVNYSIAELKDTSAPDAVVKNDASSEKKASGMSTGGWICIGISVLLGVWLLIGLIRAFSGGGGGGGNGGGGGGGGGGGFLSGMMGGMFGAMAGMYMYNQFLGGGMNSASAADGTNGGDTGGGDGGGDTGAGDWGGGGDGGGTSYDDGGGDYGGGGGGDYGGGGGDDW